MGFKRSSRPSSLRLSSSSSSEERGRTGYFDSHASPQHKQRSDSYSSDGSAPRSPGGGSSHSSKSHSWLNPTPNVNVYTYCGRHTNQLLFGGPSLTELARSMFKRE